MIEDASSKYNIDHLAAKEDFLDSVGLLSTVAGGAAVVYGEIQRTLLINPTFNGYRVPTLEELAKSKEFMREVSPAVLSVMQNMGDTAEGYMIAGLIYVGATYFDVPHKMKMGMSMLAAAGVVVAAETGLIQAGTPDLLDIPAGVVGGVLAIAAFSGGKALAKKGLEFSKEHNLRQKIGTKIEAFDQKTGLVKPFRPFLDKLRRVSGVYGYTEEEIQTLLDKENEEKKAFQRMLLEEQTLAEEERLKHQEFWEKFDKKTGLVTKIKPFLDKISCFIGYE